MTCWLWVGMGSMAVILLLLLGKIYFLKKSLREIAKAFEEHLDLNTNTLISVSGRDASVRRLAEQINRQLRRLCVLRHKYQQGDQAVKEAVTNLSHDLRTPLTAICGYLELLAKEEQTREASRYLQIIAERAQVMKQLTEELLQYTTASSAAYAPILQQETVSLNQALEESMAAFYGALTGAGIEPVISLPEKQVLCRLNKKELARILGNILNNAVKYSDGDLTVILEESGRMTFANHASGLDEIQVGALFDRFYTVEAANDSTGLGLSIARRLTEQMGGRISARYQEGVLYLCLEF